MAKTQTYYVCASCGKKSLRYMGRCPGCGEWNTLEEVIEQPETKVTTRSNAVPGAFRSAPQRLSEVSTDQGERWHVPVEEFSRVLGGGIVPGSIILVGGDPGIGKCVVGSTRVLDPVSGVYLPITEWAKEKRAVLSVDTETLRLNIDSTQAFHERGIHPIVEVKTKLGRTLRCTPNHPVLTPDGWRSVGDLPIGSRIAAPRALPYFGQQSMDDAKIKLIAYILADGSAQSQITAANMLPEVANSVGLRFLRAADKHIPDCIFSLPRQQIALFLKTLFTCAGSVYINAQGMLGISYSTISHRLAEDVQHLLLRFGLIATLHTKHSRVNGNPHTAYEIVLPGISLVKQFLAEIGIMGRAEALAKIILMRSVEGVSIHRDTIPTGEHFWRHLNTLRNGMKFKELSRCAGTKIVDRHERLLGRSTIEKLAHISDDPYLQSLAHGNVYWDEIASIMPAGEEKVYDISVDQRANFVANDLIIHNSTLLLQIAAVIADTVGRVLYVSGEESARQIKMRAERLNIHTENLYLVTETSLEAILEHVQTVQPQLMVVDSIQTTFSDDKPSSAGTVSQVRECAARLQMLAKTTGISVFLVGHVTKDGTIAGPRVLEHIVDTVLYLEGDPFHAYRLLRSVKNRFGATNEVGVFEMREVGMAEVSNPSEVFLAERMVSASGSAIVVTMEGTRPLLVEVQALASPTAYPNPRRTANGIDFNRLQLLTAVLTRRVGLRLADQDIFVNVIGGITIDEPAADLAIALAMASSVWDRPVPADLAIIGEVGLSGELRAVSHLPARMREAAKLGFKRCLIPKMLRRGDPLPDGIEAIQVRRLVDALHFAIPMEKAKANTGPASE